MWKDEDMALVFVRQAKAFIEQHKNERFFLYFAPHDPHVPRVPNARFRGQTTQGPRGDAIVQADWSVGEILASLNEFGLTDNTLVIFTSDNGPVIDDGYKDDAAAKLGTHSPSGPFRGGKYSNFEAGTRVPLIVRWPGHTRRGVSNALVSHVDLLATLAALTDKRLALPRRRTASISGKRFSGDPCPAGPRTLNRAAAWHYGKDDGSTSSRTTGLASTRTPIPSSATTPHRSSTTSPQILEKRRTWPQRIQSRSKRWKTCCARLDKRAGTNSSGPVRLDAQA